ncbi:amidohydrolase [Parvularcula lutaonensis]|uniref:Amidohydrolase n=1 Tax=Parvularcula lutaonensis TaxID=491923 RepID=A0ABV7M8Y3_9PROT|nr:amidohydrolase [Parvularcula lutaonensis]GGY42248.1 putative amidohydrolase [Parvularcula lutaonensis]
MRKLAALAASALALSAASAQDLKADAAKDWKALRPLYEHLHANPELSFEEHETAKRMARELKKLGFRVTEGVGGTGVVGVIENGEGPVVMVRADMDGLPVVEDTGLPYASKVTAKNRFGETQPAMHACGHDVHMTALIGTMRQLMNRKDDWSGTLIAILQPAEEIGEGAKAMLDDGLYDRFPTPDYVLGLHDAAQMPAGMVGYSSGWALANVDSVDLYVKGVGGHGAYPHTTKDPIVIASQIVNGLQTLVSRETDPLDSAVVTVGAFNAGYKHNIIPDEAHLQLTVRSYSDETRQRLLSGIERIARAQALAAGLPEELMPVVEISDPYTPSTYNDPDLTARATSAMAAVLGEENVIATPPVMGGEDFSQFGRTEEDVPTLIFWVGAVDPETFAKSQAGEVELPSLHSPFFAPDAEPTITTGVTAMTAAVLDLMDTE